MEKSAIEILILEGDPSQARMFSEMLAQCGAPIFDHQQITSAPLVGDF